MLPIAVSFRSFLLILLSLTVLAGDPHCVFADPPQPKSTGDAATQTASERLRVLIETDAGGDPDDEQSLVRFLLYTN